MWPLQLHKYLQSYPSLRGLLGVLELVWMQVKFKQGRKFKHTLAKTWGGQNSVNQGCLKNSLIIGVNLQEEMRSKFKVLKFNVCKVLNLSIMRIFEVLLKIEGYMHNAEMFILYAVK